MEKMSGTFDELKKRYPEEYKALAPKTKKEFLALLKDQINARALELANKAVDNQNISEDVSDNDDDLIKELGVQEVEIDPNLNQEEYLIDDEKTKEELEKIVKASEAVKVEKKEGTTPFKLISFSQNDLIGYKTTCRGMQVGSQVLVAIVCVSTKIKDSLSVATQLVPGRLVDDEDGTFKIV